LKDEKIKKVPFNIRIDERLKKALDTYCNDIAKRNGWNCSRTRMIETFLYNYLKSWKVWGDVSRKDEKELREKYEIDFFNSIIY